jgi:aspartate/methionine/tyrosine aminotransferase
MIQTTNRLHSVEEYYFSENFVEMTVNFEGKPIINMGNRSWIWPRCIGNEAIQKSLTKKRHEYQSYQGFLNLERMADFYQKQFGVALDFNSEILPLMGSKENYAYSLAFLVMKFNSNPGYPTHASVTELVQAKAVYYNSNCCYSIGFRFCIRKTGFVKSEINGFRIRTCQLEPTEIWKYLKN